MINPYYWVKGKASKATEWVKYVTTPTDTRKFREWEYWIETVCDPKHPERANQFHELFGPLHAEFSRYWATARWWRRPKYRSPAYSLIVRWMLNDLFDLAVVNQLNDNNLLRNIFRRNPLYGMEGKTIFKVEKKDE
jgi:hypothetical protein